MSRRSREATVKRAAEAASPGDRKALAAVCCFLAALVWLVFGQTAHHEFINYDDVDYVVRNAPVSQGFTIAGVAWAFTTAHSCNWHPVTWLSHMLDCQVYGLNPAGHHLTNVALHGLVAILLFLVLRSATARLWPSAFVAALFAIHPLRVESVAWVAERKDLLAGMFFLLTLGAYVRYVRAPSALRYGLVVCLFALGLMCKPMLVSLPFVLLLFDYWPLDRLRSAKPRAAEISRSLRWLIWEKLPLFGLAITSCVITLLAQEKAIRPVTRIPIPLRINNALISYVDYLRQMFWPTDLAVLYPWEAARLGAVRVTCAILVLTGISVTVYVLRRQRYLVTGWLWYLGMLVPVIGIVQVGDQARADRYTYLPQIGIYLMFVWTAVSLCANSRIRRMGLASLGAVTVLCLLFVSRAQTAYWRDSESLWTHALDSTTDNTVAEGLLGEAYHNKGKRREAMVHFEKALRIEPRQARVHSNLGVFYLEAGQIDMSLDHLSKALEIEPNLEDAQYNIGNTYLQMGRAKEALSHYRKAIELNPQDIEATNNMAWVLATCPDALLRDGPKALELAERADSLSGHQSQIATATLAAAYAECGRFPEAIAAAKHALELATAEGNTARADSIRTQIEAYQVGRAFRDHRY